jgi:phosphatidylcholine synthase
MTAQPKRFSVGKRLAAWGVHAYTASGVLYAFVAAVAIVRYEYQIAFFFMIWATVVDATDGLLARLANVKEVTPEFSGAKLDDIVDYLTFVFVPIFLLYHAGDLSGQWGNVAAVLALMGSAYGFNISDAKTDDHFFTGFPSYWNIVAVYLFAADLDPFVNAVVVIVLALLIFVRIRYVYPSRTPVLRGPTLALGAVWAAMMVLIVWKMPDVPSWLLIGSLFYPVYYTVLSLALHFRQQPA